MKGMVRRRGARGERGFTLIELLLVVAVIGIIAALAIPGLIGAIQRSRQSRSMADIRMIGEGVEAYQTDYSFYPVVSDGVVADLHDHVRFYIHGYNDHDGWGEPYSYDSDGDYYTIISFGWGGSTTLPYTNGPTSTFDADIVFTDGNFYQWPEGPQTH